MNVQREMYDICLEEHELERQIYKMNVQRDMYYICLKEHELER